MTHAVKRNIAFSLLVYLFLVFTLPCLGIFNTIKPAGKNELVYTTGQHQDNAVGEVKELEEAEDIEEEGCSSGDVMYKSFYFSHNYIISHQRQSVSGYPGIGCSVPDYIKFLNLRI